MIFILLLSFIAFAAKRAFRYLHIFQQEEYDSKRFTTWLITNHHYDKRASIAFLIATIITVFMPSLAIITIIGLAPYLAYLAWSEENPLKAAKKPLVLTERAKRTLMVAVALEVAIFITIPFFTLPLWIITIQAIPFTLMGASFLLSPFEKHIKAKFRDEAVVKLRTIKPMVIGVTGSYGKTSVKHILGHVLEFYGPTLFTPGSINTEMGIVRVIREQLGQHHKYFIVEMGAYGIGSIARLCNLTPPDISIITAIGQAHYERFKTLDDTARAKFEITASPVAKGGKVIVHESVLGQPFARDFVTMHQTNFVTVGEAGNVRTSNVVQTKDGLSLTISWMGEDYHVTTPIFGLHHAGNIAIAFAAAATIGMPPEHIILALRTAPQVAHRLEVKKFADHTLIDDAYNSNPQGFASALELLDLLGRDTRRIIVTPGMVEMGEEHENAHRILGEKTGACADIVLVVSPSRIPSYIDGFMAGRKNDKQILMNFESFAEAQDWLTKNKHEGDVILLENDLPDLYERPFSA